jgi:hypothetical protein
MAELDEPFDTELDAELAVLGRERRAEHEAALRAEQALAREANAEKLKALCRELVERRKRERGTRGENGRP